MSELKSKAAPKYKELSDVLGNQTSQNEIIILLLDRLCTLKENEGDNNYDWRQKWLDAKRSSTRFTLLQIGIGVTALYLGVIDINKDNPIVGKFISLLTNIEAFLL